MDTGKYELRPSYSDATPEQLKVICNGVGPSWAAPELRESLTRLSDTFFCEASWQHHDFGYYVGFSDTDRAYCDRCFLTAMLRDCKRLPWAKRAAAYSLAYLFYAHVRAFGRISFYYGRGYRPLPVLPVLSAKN